LSSSSGKPESSRSTAAEGGEESSLAESRIEDLITLSQAAGSELDVAKPKRALAAEKAQGPNSGTDDVASEPGASYKIKESIRETQDSEREKLDQIAQDVDKRLSETLSLRFSLDKETGTEIFQLVEPESGDVVRQIPAEDVLEFMKKFEESVSGLLISQQA
jgi:flagellar protein FlaG